VEILVPGNISPKDYPSPVRSTNQWYQFAKKILRLVGQLGSGVSVSASFQIISRGTVRNGGISAVGSLHELQHVTVNSRESNLRPPDCKSQASITTSLYCSSHYQYYKYCTGN